MEVKNKKPVSADGDASEFIRQFKARPLVFVGTILVLVIVIIAFVFVPVFVPGAAGRAGDMTFGYWNKVPINHVPGNYFARSLREAADSVRYSIDETNSMYVNYRVWRQAFEETVVHAAILDAMGSAGYAAPAYLVDRRVAQHQDFQENGRFSPALWNRMDSTRRQGLWKEIQDSIAVERYMEDVTGLRVSGAEKDFIAAMGGLRRSFEMVAIPLSSWPEGELAAWVQENPGSCVVTRLSRITVTSNAREAEQILRSVQDGTASFEDAAKLHSRDSRAESGGDLGIRMVFELGEDLPEKADRDIVAALRAGEFSPVIKTGEGWVFFRAEEDPRPADTGDASAMEKIRAYVMNWERGRVEDWVLADAGRFIENVRSNGLSRAAFFRGLDLRSFGPLPLNYGSRSYNAWGYESDGVDLFPTLASFSVEELSSAGALGIFWETAFSTPLNEPSAPFVVGDNVVVLVPVSEEAATEEELDGIRSTFSSWWLGNSTRQGLRALFLASGKLKDRFSEAYRQVVRF